LHARFTLRRRSRGSRFGLRTHSLFGTEGFDACRLETRGFRRNCLLLGREGSGRFRGGRRCSSLLFGGGLHVGSLSTATDWFASGRYGLGWGGFGRGGASPTARRRRGGSRLLFGAHPLFPFPTRPDSRDLVVGEHAHVAANGNVHLPKKRYHFFGGHREFAGQLTH
jgi:hypothetical protein